MNARPHDNCYWVIPGRLMAGEYPIAIREEDGLRKLSAIVAAGISHFIDLTEKRDPLAPYEPLQGKLLAAEPPGYDRFAIPDMGIPDSPDLTNSILDRIDGLMARKRAVYVHCWGGIGRTGTVVGCWLVRHGLTGEQALNRIATHWQVMEKRTRFPQSPQTDMQVYYIHRWAVLDRGPKHPVAIGH
ncbi:MAG: dual specificity protein phosphatase family protein [Caldilineales bacterium]|nr:dual specificity protein phosphatase family protein [Planctomycetales bacterium]MCW5856686.1 dual specificity protein phosphatase family protein [Caldilineales bacterium]